MPTKRLMLGLPPLRDYGLINWALCVCILVVAGWIGHKIALSYIPPSEYQDAYAEPPIVQQGDSLHIVYRILRKRYCPTFLHQFIYEDDETPTLVWSAVKAGGYTELGSRASAHEIKEVRFLPPGKYIFKGAGNPRCPEGEFFYFHQPIKFTVVPKEPS